jgi:hypothetical protein
MLDPLNGATLILDGVSLVLFSRPGNGGTFILRENSPLSLYAVTPWKKCNRLHAEATQNGTVEFE